MPTLYPSFALPPQGQDYGEGPYPGGKDLLFDFARGDFVLDGSGRLQRADAHASWQQWCLKTLLTKRSTCLAYGQAIGIDDVLHEKDPKVVESLLTRTITQALLANPRTEAVGGFAFAWQGDQLYCSFWAKEKQVPQKESFGIQLR